ncbi:hypothetical protein AJ80_10066 [Polytolypa hystricis UAMH7299]|uniref:Uncharacterized protein n=1 Tax=Polytolypa hystricis (strain UAMH7299) TaxID=1447883 RepID=A0A2B7WEJ6_POLH7|nr:hypothetical protein AJ80_10066 [Polytolypa hystricis UAMH7299]
MASLPLIAVVVFAAVMTKIPFSIGSDFEEIFNNLKMYRIASRIRKVKEFFQSKSNLSAQDKWIEDDRTVRSSRTQLILWEEFVKRRS